MMQKSTTFITTFRVKKCYFHYDFAYKKVPLSLRYAKNYVAPFTNKPVSMKIFFIRETCGIIIYNSSFNFLLKILPLLLFGISSINRTPPERRFWTETFSEIKNL
jgi:hypothetical protein